MTLDNLIEELTRLEKEATPGPWEGRGYGHISAHVPQSYEAEGFTITTSLTPLLRLSYGRPSEDRRRPPTPGREVMGRCDECRFWRDLSKFTAIKFQDGAKECRRRAPLGAVNYGYAHGKAVRAHIVSAWAITAADDGCGEFEPQGDAKT